MNKIIRIVYSNQRDHFMYWYHSEGMPDESRERRSSSRRRSQRNRRDDTWKSSWRSIGERYQLLHVMLFVFGATLFVAAILITIVMLVLSLL
jgi:hypothetical protein